MTEKQAKKFPFEKIAKLDAPERREKQPVAPLIEAIDPRPGMKVVDLGVGTGYFAIPFAHRVRDGLEEWQVFGVDSEPGMLEVLEERAEEAGVGEVIRPQLVETADNGALPFRDFYVDIVVAGNLVHELDDRPRAFSDVARILSAGGRFAVVDWDADEAATWGPPADHRIAAHVIEAELTAAGFDRVATLDLYKDHYVIVGTKS